MRTAIVLGLIALFSLVAFVPPNGATNGTIARAQEMTDSLTIDFNMDLNAAVQGAKTHATNAVKNVPKIEVKIPTKLDVTLPDPNVIAKEAAPSLFKRLFAFTLETASNQIVPEIQAVPANWRKAAEDEPNETLRHYFLLIEWAREKADIRACDELTPTVLEERTVDGKSILTPTRGDWIAYCLARVTKNYDRCKQIQTTTLPPLKSLCEQEHSTSDTF